MSTKDSIPKRKRTVIQVTKKSTAYINISDAPSQRKQEESKKNKREKQKTIASIPETEPTRRPDPPKPAKDKKFDRPITAEAEATFAEPPPRKRRKRVPEKDAEKEYYDALRVVKSGFAGMETARPVEDQNVVVNDATALVSPIVQRSGGHYSAVRDSGAASSTKSGGLTRTPAMQRKRVRDIDIPTEEAESARILRDYVRKIANMKEVTVAKVKGEEAAMERSQAHMPMIVRGEALRQGAANVRATPKYTVRVPHPDHHPHLDASPTRKRKNTPSFTQGSDGLDAPPTPPPHSSRKKIKLAPSSQKQEMAEAVVRDLLEHNQDNHALIGKLKRMLPHEPESGPGKLIYVVGSPKTTVGKPVGSDSSSTEKGNSASDLNAAKERQPPQTPNSSANEELTVRNLIERGHVSRGDVMVGSRSYNLLEHVRNANSGSSSSVRGHLMDDRFLVPKTNFKNAFLLHKGLEKYFNHSTGARLSLSQHFPPTFTLPQPSDDTLSHIALQIHHAAQQANVADTIGGWAVMSVLFSCGRFKVAGVGVVLPDVKLAAKVDFRGWPFLVEGAEVTGEVTVEPNRTGAGDREKKDNKQQNEKDQKILDAAKTLTDLHQNHEESDTDTEPFMETKIVKVPENAKNAILTADYYQDEAWPYKYTPPPCSPSLEHLESTVMRTDYLTISFDIHNSTMYPGDIVRANTSSTGMVCARRVHTSLKGNAMLKRVVTREYCAETLDGSGFCQAGDMGSRVWREDPIGNDVYECGRILAAVVGMGAALVNVGLICLLRAEA